MKMRKLDSRDADFRGQLETLLAWPEETNANVAEIVRTIVDDVRRRGDAALIGHTNRFDQRHVGAAADLVITKDRINAALDRLQPDLRSALQIAADRIRAYHEHQLQGSWSYTHDGTLLGQRITPLERVGVYVPGGKAAYPSSVLMSVIPAKVAGVNEVIMVVPLADDEANDLVLAAASLVGIDRAFSIGGAQAVAALAYGTETVPKVDKIVGPGNVYVAEAKRLVFGAVGIDMIAGPSEVVVVCDGQTDPDWIAMDLFAQAEHDENAQALLICPDPAFLDRVAASVERLLPEMERSDIIRTSLSRRGALIRIANLDEAVELVNVIAPEHLELAVADPEFLLSKIRHAGAIFMGHNTAEVLGDYCAGPNHVLPTSRTARYSSPLGVYDFQKRSSLIQCTAEAAAGLGRTAARLARGEGLTAHARSAEYRMMRKDH
ncbi:MAG: histidinol dehydrogenase [Gammaproteobacteria bacterium]|nr:histidinol dehydrogenase [Gammaproteobacteria bacterium]